jgi:dolichol kinase
MSPEEKNNIRKMKKSLKSLIRAHSKVADKLTPSPNRTAQRIFLSSLTFTSVMTLIWIFFVITKLDGGLLFNGYEIDQEALKRIAVAFTIIVILYGWFWYRVRRFLLRRLVGLSEQEIKSVFESRMDRPFDLSAILARHSERRIRIIDMIGRRGRALTLAAGYNVYVYLRISAGLEPRFLTAALVDGLLDAILLSWLYLSAYYSNGLLGRVVYGAPSRIMDGTLARANLLSIVTLWNCFKFVMVPLGIQMTPHFPPQTYTALFGFIWVSYQISDTLAEIVGSVLGKQKLRVWGIGEVNRKSIAGTWACFLGSFCTCLLMIYVHHLPLPWLGLAAVVSISNTFFELFSPRGTDDFTMATANGLLCWAFGVLIY